jgi:hypothetical protein
MIFRAIASNRHITKNTQDLMLQHGGCDISLARNPCIVETTQIALAMSKESATLNALCQNESLTIRAQEHLIISIKYRFFTKMA